MKKKHCIVNCDLYKQDIVFSIAESDKELLRYLKRYVIKESSEFTHIPFKESTDGKCISFENGVILVRIKKYPKYPYDFAVIAHEIFHAVEFTMERVGMTHSVNESSEAYAYMIQFLTEHCYRRLLS